MGFVENPVLKFVEIVQKSGRSQRRDALLKVLLRPEKRLLPAEEPDKRKIIQDIILILLKYWIEI